MSHLRAETTTTADPAEVLAEHVRRLVDTFPPLTADQRDRLAALLRGARRPATSAHPRSARRRPASDH